jgi:hypothetical protein
MQAIITKFIGPTNTRGSRIKATCEAGHITIPYPHAENTGTAHRMAAQALVDKLGWTTTNYGPLVGGGTPDGTGYAFVFALHDHTCPTTWYWAEKRP